MKYHGVEIDFLGLAAVISALAALWTAIKGTMQKAKIKEVITNDESRDENQK